MEKQPKTELTQNIFQDGNANLNLELTENLELPEEIKRKWKEEDEQWRKEGLTGFEIELKRFGPLIKEIEITDELIKQWEEEDEQWRKEGFTEHEITEKRFGPLIREDDLFEE